MGIRNFNLQRSQLRKRGTIRSLVQMTLGKWHREFTVPVFLCQGVTQMPLLCPPSKTLVFYSFSVFPRPKLAF